jgi:carboxyl-terminal processing protease
VHTKGRLGNVDAPTAPGPPLTTKPLTVLVNEHSASAAEILAGALQDNCRAVLVGKKTYGKGLIQSVYALSDGSGLVATVGQYLTPNLTDIDQFGIRPDFEKLPSPEKQLGALDACRVPSRS